MQPGELKTEYDELNPKWRGRIVISDPRRLAEQGGQQFFYSQTPQGRELWPRLLNEMRPAVIEDARLHLDSVARGTYAIGGLGIATVRQEVSTMKKLGLPIDTVELGRPAEWSADAASGLGVFINAPHPNVVKLGGWIGIATAAAAWYASFAAVTNATFNRTVMPVRPWTAR